MGIQNLQICDMCSQQRDLGGRAGSADGWRQIPVRKKYGDARPEQPWVCPDCLEKVERYVDSNGQIAPPEIRVGLKLPMEGLWFEITQIEQVQNFEPGGCRLHAVFREVM